MNNLRYGQIVRIQSDYGMIVTKGYTQTNVYYMTYTNLAKISNFRESLFQVLPKGSFEIHDEFMKSHKKANQDLLDQRLKTELNQYFSFVETKMDEEVLFGQEIVLKHYDSEYFLVGSYKCSEQSMEAFQVSLSSKPSSQALFRIEAYQTYQKDGQLIYFDEPFLLVNTKQQFCLDFIEKPIQWLDDESCLGYVKQLNDVQRHQVIITHNSKTNWKMKLFMRNDQRIEKKSIRNYELIYLQYTEDGTYLNGEQQIVSLQQAGLHIPLTAIWELQILQPSIDYKRNQPQLNKEYSRGSVFQNNNDLVKDFSRVAPRQRSVVDQQQQQAQSQINKKTPQQEFILRNYISGKVLTSRGQLPQLHEYVQESNQIVEILVAKQGQQDIVENSYIQLSVDKEILQNVEIEDQWNDSIKEDDELETTVIKKQLTFEEKEHQHAFQIKKVKVNIKNNLMFVLSAQEVLFQFVLILNKQVDIIWKLLHIQQLSQVVEVIQQLIQFLQFEVANRQQCIKETYIIDLAMKILVPIYEKKLYATEVKNLQKKMKKIFKLTYQLIKELTQNNKQLKQDMGKYLKDFLEQAMDDEARAQDSLKELLEDNYESIQRFVTDDHIQKVYEKMKYNPNEKYLSILSSICVCKGRAILKNQILILKLVFQSNELLNFKFRLNTKNKVEVLCRINKLKPMWRRIRQIYQESQEQDGLQTWNYFQGYFNLLGDVCYNRNKLAQDFVKENISISILLALVEDNHSQSINTFESYLKVIHLAYVDTPGYQSLVISKVIDWEENELIQIEKRMSMRNINSFGGISNHMAQQNVTDINNIIKYVQQFIAKFTHFTYDQKYNQTLQRVLMIIKTLLTMNLEIDTMQLLHDLLRICSCQKDFQNLEQQKGEENIKKAKNRMTKVSLENKPIMECKMLASNIILNILDLENDIRINQMVAYFRNKRESDSTNEQTNNSLPKKGLISGMVDFVHRFSHKPPEEQQQLLDNNSSVFKDFAKSLSGSKDKTEQESYNIPQWIQVIKDLVDNRNLFKNFNNNVMLVFAEISLMQEPKMVETALQLFNRMLGQKRELIKHFSQIVLLSKNCQKNVKELISKCIQIRQRLEQLSDKNVYTITKENQSTSNIQVDEIIEDLNKLCVSLKLQRFQSQVVQISLAFNECEENDKTNQTLFKALDMHQTLVTYISGADEINPYLQGLLNSCYKFLTLFIWNHATNKIEIKWPLKQIYQHLQYNSCCIDFVRELYHNNKELLYNENEVSVAIRSIIQQMNKEKPDSMYRVKLFDSLRVFLYDHNKTIKFNQLQILALLQQKQNRNLIYVLNELQSEFSMDSISKPETPLQKSKAWDSESFHELIDDYSANYEKMEETKLMRMQPELQYMIIHFEIFSLLVEDNNVINQEKCRVMHPFHSLLFLMKNSYKSNCWPLQHFLRSYINRLYYNSQMELISQLCIQEDLEIIRHQLDQILLLKGCNYIKQVQIVDGVRFQFMFSYIFACMQEILYSINLLFLNDNFLSELEGQLSKDIDDLAIHQLLFKIAGHLVQIQKMWFKSSHITHLCQVLINIMKIVFRTFDISVLLRLEKIFNGNVSEPQTPLKQDDIQEKDKENLQTDQNEQNEQDGIINRLLIVTETKLSQDEKIQSNLQQTLKRIFHLKSKKRLSIIEEPDNNAELNIRLMKLIKLFNENEEFQGFIEQEFNQLCSEFTKIDEFSLTAYQTQYPAITLEEFLKNLIQMNITHQLNDDLRSYFLKILTRMISEKNPNINGQDEQAKLAIDEWEPEFWSDSRQQIQEIQCFLAGCGAAQLIYEMFKENFDDRWELFNQLLIFSNAFLLGGNTKCQDSLLLLLKQDSSNQMMSNLQQSILKFSKFVNTNFKIQKTKFQKDKQNPFLSIVYVDNLTQFSEKTETLKRTLPSAIESQNTIKNRKLSIKVMWRAFRMLQLMCENNNVQMKNYLREQTDKEDSVHINSINFIEFATKELRILLKILNKNVVSITQQIVDFINEVIQLPCFLNQVTLCKSTYMEDVCFTFETFQKEESQLIQRELHTPEEQDELFELQAKIIQSIMLVLEGNNQKNYEELQQKLDCRFLVNFIKLIVQKVGIEKIFDFKKEARFSDEIQQMLNVFIIKEKIEYVSKDQKWVKHFKQEFESNPTLKDIQTMCLNNLRKIEIFYENEYQMVFFPAHPVFQFLSDETRDKIMFKIPRDTQRKKLISLLEEMEMIFSEISYNFSLQNWILPITHKTIQLLINISQLLSLIINIFMIFAYAVMIKDKQSTLVTDDYEEATLFILSLLQFSFSLCACTFYIISRASLEFKKLKQEQFSLTKIHSYIIQKISNFIIVFKGEDFLSHISFTAIAFLGLISNTYYFSLHLFYLFGQLSLLQSVFQAISHNAKQLSLVALLGVLFQFVFSIVGFNNYVDDIYPEQVDDPCHSLISCMITLMTSGVIGSSMSQWDPLKFIYDTVYFVFFALLFTNIISGIMTDTFAQLRDQRNQIEDDKKNKCFICGIDRQTLEKQQEDFEEHIKSKHFLWNYVFYIYCLQNKDSTEYTGLEYWIMDKVQSESVSWFPIRSEDEDDRTKQIELLQQKIEDLAQQLKTQLLHQQIEE
ncbi:unnamed protein product [Paramecium pentaurelia]|uniref:Uncharacterized protein n=1 Tax=Paramecium pentaurelia TaxID=43138 RepID=A0A8S1WXC8_9CILI|nr:unnamed protein product [Paramecium pentaurelia]